MSVLEKQPPRFLIQTLGCKVNQYDSERIRTQLLRRGYRSVLAGDGAEPDLIVVNTCSVTSESDRKGRQTIRKLIRRHPNARVMVTGCYSERKPEEIQSIEGVNEIVPIEAQERWVERITEEMGWGCEDQDALWDAGPNEEGRGIESFEEHTRAFVKIQDGCDLKCTYCSIPQSRGRARSRSLPDVLQECERLVQRGYPEIVICGICIGHYGRDLDTQLHDLVRAVSCVKDLKRLRISSLEPQHASDELFGVMREMNGVICPHLHLPLQSGSSRILRRMNRLYTMEYFAERVQTARELLPDFELSSDVMTGFPGETEEDFERSLDAVRSCQFNKVHSFRYSAREDTPATRMKDRLPHEIVEERRRELDRVALDVADSVKQRYIGRTMAVLTETAREGWGTGFTNNYLRVEFQSPQTHQSGEIIQVQIEKRNKGRLLGTVVS